jgi:ABC-type phosphate transport system substrate-binding protein
MRPLLRMRKSLLSLVLAAALGVASATTASAAPTETTLTVGPKAQFVAPSTLLVPVTVTCPATFVSGFTRVQVSQSDTGGTGFGFVFMPCTGNPETIVIVVDGGPFTLGQAIADGLAFAGGQFDQDIRRIQIVL